jgi:ATP-dependent DNA helicase RecQ
MAAQLNATEGVPLLLLSATCRPQEISSILENLQLTEDNVTFVRAELTRPEIRILRLTMKHSLKSGHDIIPVIEHPETANINVPPTLVYSGQRNATFQIMKNINSARGTPGAEYNPRSSMIRRYHANTGDYAKEDAVKAFTSGKFPYIACTMALGLGQNWKQIRKVIHMGRANPSNICQMIGRCGRDGEPGLAIMFVEKSQRNGKNSVDEFANVKEQTNDDRMDALAITPVCLRIAFLLDNL